MGGGGSLGHCPGVWDVDTVWDVVKGLGKVVFWGLGGPCWLSMPLHFVWIITVSGIMFYRDVTVFMLEL